MTASYTTSMSHYFTTYSYTYICDRPEDHVVVVSGKKEAWVITSKKWGPTKVLPVVTYSVVVAVT